MIAQYSATGMLRVQYMDATNTAAGLPAAQRHRATELWVGRAVVLLSVLLMLWAMLAYRPTRSFAIAFAFLGLMQFHLFHYVHYSMAEMMGVALLLLGIFMLRLAYGLEHRAWYAAASLAFGLAFLSKVTFAYALLLPFVARYFLFLSERTRGRDSMRDLLADTFIMAVVTGSFASRSSPFASSPGFMERRKAITASLALATGVDIAIGSTRLVELGAVNRLKTRLEEALTVMKID
jgi:hypothetical protein